VLVFKAWRKSPALTQETTPSQRRITRMLSEAQQAAAAEFDTQLPRVAELLSRGRVNEVTNMLPMDPWVDVQEPLAYELLGELLDAGSRVRLPVLQKAELVFSFDRGRPESAAWAWNQAGQLIVQITQEQRQVVQQVVSQAATGAVGWMGTNTGGMDWTGVSRQVRNTIGLTAQQAGWVTNHYDRAYTTAIRNGASSAQAAALASQSAARYQTSVHRYRANTIARTETMRAASEGRQQAWGQGMTQGFIDSLWQKEWIAEGDACDICQAIDGKRIGVKDSFPVGEPPAHPNCRCDVLLVPPKPQPQPQGGGLLDGFPAEQFIPDLFSGPPSLNTPAPDRPEPTFIGMPAGVFIGMPRVVTFGVILDDAREMAEAAMARAGNMEGDPFLGEIYKRRGFDGLPTVIDQDAFDELVDGGATPLYRGISGERAPDYLDAFRSGDYYPGLGVYGNGTYSSTRFDEAFSYAGSNGDQVVRMVLSPGSNVITYDDLRKEWTAFLDSPAFDALDPTQRRLVADIGRYAVARGYDAIDVAGTDATGVGNGIYVIFNRSRVTVAATNGLGPRNIYQRDLENAWYAFIRENREAAEQYGIDGMDAWAWDQGYRYVHTQSGRVRGLSYPDF
jgi:SPP1 gp7 family putative phage head morphogenesis protein